MTTNLAALNRLLLDRRTLLMGLGAAGAVACLPRCSNDGGGKGADASTASDSLVSLRELSRSSPDHLSARAAALIARKDFTGAVDFVRDNVGVLPPPDAGSSALYAVRWGPDATLRAGAGTQRERADLLQAMLVAMGASAKVVYCNKPSDVDAAALYAARPPAYDVDYDALAVRRDVRSALVTAPHQADPDVSGIMASILAMLPAGQAQVAYASDGVSSLVPIVEYTANGATKWAIALGGISEVLDAPSGLSSSGLEAATYPDVAVRLLGAFTPAPDVAASNELVEMVAGSWRVDQLAGSRLFVTTSASNPNLVGTDAAAVRSPALTVQQPYVLSSTDPAVWTPKVAAPPASFVGPAFTMQGERYSEPTTPGGAAVGPYGSFVELDSVAHAAALAAVATVSATVNGGSFPNMRINIAALDASGRPVYGLVQSDFTVADETVEQQPVLLANTAAPVKVMLSYGCSGSVTWPTPGDKTAFDTALASAMVTSASTVPFNLGVAPVGANASAYVAPDATTIGNAIAACSSDSDVWATLGELAPKASISAIVLVSDFQSTDDPATIAALKVKLAASGLAVALVPVSAAVEQATIDAIVEACGATVLDWTAGDFQAKLTTFVTTAAERAVATGYRSAYRLPDDQQTNQTARTVNVALASRPSVSAVAAYDVPAVESRASTGVAGLYLELRVGTGERVLRRLSGPQLDEVGLPVAATQADYDMTRALLNGLTTVGFEAGSPTAAINVDEMMTAALSLEPLMAMVGQPLVATLPTGAATRNYSASFAMLFEANAAVAAGTPTAPQTLRVTIMTEALEDRGFFRRFDVVPALNLTVAAEADPVKAFAATMRATMPISFREGLVLTESAAGALASASLQYLAPTADASALTGFSEAERNAWAAVVRQYRGWHKLVPTTASTGAMWIVDPSTGTTAAVYLNGMGGGCAAAVANAAVQVALYMCGAYASFASLTCKGPTTALAWECLGATIGSIAAGGSAVLAAAILDDASGDDYIILALTIIASITGGPAGVGIAVMSIPIIGNEAANSLYQHC